MYAIGYGLCVSVEADYTNNTAIEPVPNQSVIYISEQYSLTWYSNEYEVMSWSKPNDSNIINHIEMLEDTGEYNKLCTLQGGG